MNPRLDVHGRNMVVAMLVESLLGAVSPNFRCIGIDLGLDEWTLRFFLAEESTVDREEIDDAVAEFDAKLLDLNERGLRIKVEVAIGSGSLPVVHSSTWRPVFMRRESWDGPDER